MLVISILVDYRRVIVAKPLKVLFVRQSRWRIETAKAYKQETQSSRMAKTRVGVSIRVAHLVVMRWGMKGAIDVVSVTSSLEGLSL